ncbi:PalH-domain-containing protein [Hortaea werneckii]|nr:PalH-domain-containing protein [Hortaea werneckii]
MYQDAFPTPTTLVKRQLWGLPDTTTEPTHNPHCTPFTLPSEGVLSFGSSAAITLTTNVVFQPKCTGDGTWAEGISSITSETDPFYASTIPQIYVISATTVIAWMLVIMLTIMPRTNFLGNPSAGPGFSNGRGIIGGATGGTTNLIGVGSRPWLQKVAAFTVAVSLTIATADAFKVAQRQYSTGFADATELREEVMGSLEIRITRVISDIFIWLAQVQTLIRLFPRHKEKVIIKWIGFALILCDTVFSCLNSFFIDHSSRPGQFVDAIPALSYLFELALSLLYAAWVIYYSLTKRRYAFYHEKMRSICVIALLSIVAVLTPVVFFVTDVSNQDIAGWGDYFRWVGAAAASVVVWEWVERIEAIERDEKKDGILGREIYDGDEMLDVTPREAVLGGGRGRRSHKQSESGGSSSGHGGGHHHTSALEKGLHGVANRFRRTQQAAATHFPLGRAHSTTANTTPEPGATMSGSGRVAFGRLPKPRAVRNALGGQTTGGPTPPPPVAVPPSRADTSSATSTVYVVRYDTAPDTPQPLRRRAPRQNGNQQMRDEEKEGLEEADEERPNQNRNQGNRWYSVGNPFKRKRASPPAEVREARRAAAGSAGSRSATPAHNFAKWDLKGRLGVLAAETGERFRDRQTHRQPSDPPLTIIPAQPRGSNRTWSPDLLHQQGNAENGKQQPADGSATSSDAQKSGSTTLTANSDPDRFGSDPRLPQPQQMPRIEDNSPLGAGGAGSPSTPNRSPQPPAANDIAPARNSNTPTVIPAPRRSPLRISTSAAGHRDRAEDEVVASTTDNASLGGRDNG